MATKYGGTPMIDEFDKRILEQLQRDNRQSMGAIGDSVGLSEPAVRRRVKRLRDAGYIIADVSLIDPQRAGITVIVSIRFEKESHQTYERFKAEMAQTPQITQCYTVTGDEDFILIGHFSDMLSYEAWINDRILSNRDISRSTTNVVYSRVKYKTAIEL
ncbi:MAG: Lrp/AsnC family transcriptional regulator [Pseudomonadota bacterium]